MSGSSKLRKGDTVMIIAGGNSISRDHKGKTGKIRSLSGDRVIVEGFNFVSRHQKQVAMNAPHGKIPKESPIHASNLMYFAEKINKPVKLTSRKLDDGRKVRGYLDPANGNFEQIDI